MKRILVGSWFVVCSLMSCGWLVAGDAPVVTSAAGASVPLAPPVPPSPSTAPGIRIWPDPQFTHWPVIAYGDETRNIAFALPVRQGGITGTIGWQNQTPLPITLPQDAERISGLLPLSLTVGEQVAMTEIGSARFPLRVKVVDVHDAWPIVRLENGFPVASDGSPVVLLDRRRGTREERMWSFLDGSATRPTGRAVVVGDPMTAQGQSSWDGADVEQRITHDERYPHHAVLIALGTLLQPATGAAVTTLPRSIVWCPGNQTLYGAAWSAEEERVLGAVRSRFERLGVLPRLILCLPPMPIEDYLQDIAIERRELLQRSASRLGWVVVDFGRAAGPANKANRLADQVFTRYPQGDALARMREAFQAALAH